MSSVDFTLDFFRGTKKTLLSHSVLSNFLCCCSQEVLFLHLLPHTLTPFWFLSCPCFIYTAPSPLEFYILLPLWRVVWASLSESTWGSQHLEPIDWVGNLKGLNFTPSTYQLLLWLKVELSLWEEFIRITISPYHYWYTSFWVWWAVCFPMGLKNRLDMNSHRLKKDLLIMSKIYWHCFLGIILRALV